MTDLQQKFDALDASLSGQLAALTSATAANAAGLQALAAMMKIIGGCICQDAVTDPTGEPAPVEMPAPNDLCGAYERVQRIQAWQLQGERTVGGVACKLWAPIMSYQAQLQGWRPGPATEGGKRAHTINKNAFAIFWCISWDFTGMEAPKMVYEDVRASNYNDVAESTIGYEIPLGTQIRGSRANDKPAPWKGPGNPESFLYCQYIFAYPANHVSPPYNVWFRYPGQG